MIKLRDAEIVLGANAESSRGKKLQRQERRNSGAGDSADTLRTRMSQNTDSIEDPMGLCWPFRNSPCAQTHGVSERFVREDAKSKG